MEAALAQQLGAALLQYATENPQSQYHTDSPLFTLLGSLSGGHRTSVSIEGPDHVTDHQANASKTCQLSETSSVVHVPRPSTKAYISRLITFTERGLFRNDQSTFFREQYLRWRHICA